MAAYKSPDFNERAALSRAAKQKALDQLRAKPAPTEAELAEGLAARLRREEAEAEQRAARAAEKIAAAAEKAAAEDARAEAEAAAARAAQAAIVPPKSEAEKKADRDARYAARKSRK